MTDFDIFTKSVGSKWIGCWKFPGHTKPQKVLNECGVPKQFDDPYPAYVAATQAFINRLETKITSTETEELIALTFDTSRIVKSNSGKQVEVQQKRRKIA